MRWGGFRKVRSQVCKRISRRLDDLGLDDLEAYRSYLDSHDEEWNTLGSLCRVTISRFYRDRGMFEKLRSLLLPSIVEITAARGKYRVRCWSAGCASGEEPYTLAIMCDRYENTRMSFEIVATDADARMLARARAGRYNRSSLKDLPDELREKAFTIEDGKYAIKDRFKRAVEFQLRDIRDEPPPGFFDIIFCRNLAFTYYDGPGQEAVLDVIRRALVPGGFLVIGVHERLPSSGVGFRLFGGFTCVYQFRPAGPEAT
jgi:chemotaxis protein methyltransferase CheR